MDEQTKKTTGRKKMTAMCPVENNCGGSCSCNGSNWNCHHSCPIMRWFLGLVILVLVFGLGMKIGEMKAQLRGSDFGWRNDNWGGMMNNRSQRIMIVDDSFLPTVPDTVKTGTTTKKK